VTLYNSVEAILSKIKLLNKLNNVNLEEIVYMKDVYREFTNIKDGKKIYKVYTLLYNLWFVFYSKKSFSYNNRNW